MSLDTARLVEKEDILGKIKDTGTVLVVELEVVLNIEEVVMTSVMVLSEVDEKDSSNEVLANPDSELSEPW